MSHRNQSETLGQRLTRRLNEINQAKEKARNKRDGQAVANAIIAGYPRLMMPTLETFTTEPEPADAGLTDAQKMTMQESP